MFIAQFSDAVFIAKLIDFVIFVATIVWLYNKFGQPALVAHQQAQNKLVEDALAERTRRAASVDEARRSIEQARVDSIRMVEIGRAQSLKLRDSEEQAATAHAERVRAHAAGELERERYRVRRELLEDTVAQAHERATAIAKQEIGPEQQRVLVERLLAELERAHA